ncbi:MAG: restriction endonuclease [Planctomycetota bacterium]|jgi:hypothetical protein|nr:restriction endonuclease [Planctomycetota bacterium]
MINQDEFENLLTAACARLDAEARREIFRSSPQFENRAREVLQDGLASHPEIKIDFDPHPQAFPDIAVERFGVEVKFTLNDTWRSVANSVLESHRVETVEKVYLIFGKMGGEPEVKWADYEQSVMHVRTSHVPRFEVEISTARSLFDLMGVKYDDFRQLPMSEKMRYIRNYARSRLQKGERLWWLEDSPEAEHALPIQARLYTGLSMEEKTKLRAEAVLLCPSVVDSRNTRDKYNDVVLYLLTYRGVLCHQARDLFSAGSVANPTNDDEGGIYIERALKLLETEMTRAALTMDDALFVEYWGESVPPQKRIARWLEKADAIAKDWTPSKSLFVNYRDK